MLIINGNESDFAGKTVKEMIDFFQYEERTIAVEVNEKILPKQEFTAYRLQDGDCVEVVSFVGGG